MKHQPRKRFGQNFLQNQAVIEAILQAIHLQPDDNLLEIGPGLGALTQPLLQRLNSLKAIEIDWDLQRHVQSLPGAAEKLHLIAADALKVDYDQFGDHLRIVGNLPYNVSTPLLFHLLRFVSRIRDMHFMLQKEVVERLAASPGTKRYGRLSVMIQYYCQADYVFTVPPTAFFPEPKVESAIVRLTPYPVSPHPTVSEKVLERLVAQSFSMRRKTLANNLKNQMDITELAALGIDAKKRPEQITVAEYVQIAKFIAK